MTQSSYYTGVEEADEKLRELYTKQAEIETQLRRLGCSLFDTRECCKKLHEEFRKVIQEQDRILFLFKETTGGS